MASTEVVYVKAFSDTRMLSERYTNQVKHAAR